MIVGVDKSRERFAGHDDKYAIIGRPGPRLLPEPMAVCAKARLLRGRSVARDR